MKNTEKKRTNERDEKEQDGMEQDGKEQKGMEQDVKRKNDADIRFPLLLRTFKTTLEY